MSESATYVYCLLSSAAAPGLEGLPPGLVRSGPLRALRAGDDLWLIVSDVPLHAYDGPAIEARLEDLDWVSARALEHERVVEALLRQGTVVPLRLFTLFSEDARAVAFAHERREAIAAAARRIAGCEEWGVRLTLDKERARRAAESAVPAAGSGAAFLLRKKAARDAAMNALARAEEKASLVLERLSPVAREVRRKKAPGRSRPPPRCRLPRRAHPRRALRGRAR